MGIGARTPATPTNAPVSRPGRRQLSGAACLDGCGQQGCCWAARRLPARTYRPSRNRGRRAVQGGCPWRAGQGATALSACNQHWSPSTASLQGALRSGFAGSSFRSWPGAMPIPNRMMATPASTGTFEHAFERFVMIITPTTKVRPVRSERYIEIAWIFSFPVALAVDLLNHILISTIR